MKKTLFLSLLVLAAFVLLVDSASAVTPKPRPLPTLPPTTPTGEPIVSAS